MQVQQISFKNNSITPEQRISSGQAFMANPEDKFEPSNKKDNALKYILAGLGVVAAIVAIIKHKQIGEFFTKLFKNGEKAEDELQPPKQKPSVKNEPPIVPLKPKFELPKPDFKYNESNPVEFAKEKDAYIHSIISYARQNENTAHEVMEQFDKYGSSKNLMGLATDLSVSENKTDKMVQDYLRLYKKFGFLEQPPEIYEDCDASLLSFVLKEFQEVISKDSMMLMIEEFKRTGNDALALTELRSFLESKAQNPFLKKFSDGELNEIRKFAQDAEEIVKKRVYKDSK